MNVNLTLGCKTADNYKIKDYLVVLIDVLRASSTITAAFEKGVKRIYSVKEKKEVLKLKSKNKNLILVGERHGIKIKDFDFGNSPVEIYNLDLKDKEIVFNSSNFSRVLEYYKDSPIIIVGCILNAKAVANYIKLINAKNNIKVLLVQVGTAEIFSEEDHLGSKIILQYLRSRKINLSQKEITYKLINSRNGKYLSSIGYKKDVEFCSILDKFQVVPIKIRENYFRITHQSK